MQSIGTVLVLILLLHVSNDVLCNTTTDITNPTLGDQDADSTGLLGNHEEVTVSIENADHLLNYSKGDQEEILEGSGDDKNTDDVGRIDPVQKYCQEPGYREICSGHGVCAAGECRCDDGSDTADAVLKQDPTYRYSGKYCEECPYCNGQRCTSFLPCVLCHLVERGADCPTCPDNYTEVKEVTRNVSNDDKLCNVEYSRGCYIKFKYFYRGSVPHLETESVVECFHGGVYVFYIYWALIFFLILIIAVTPKLCLLIKRDRKLKAERNRMTLARRYLYNEIRPSYMRETQL